MKLIWVEQKVSEEKMRLKALIKYITYETQTFYDLTGQEVTDRK